MICMTLAVVYYFILSVRAMVTKPAIWEIAIGLVPGVNFVVAAFFLFKLSEKQEG